MKIALFCKSATAIRKRGNIPVVFRPLQLSTFFILSFNFKNILTNLKKMKIIFWIIIFFEDYLHKNRLEMTVWINSMNSFKNWKQILNFDRKTFLRVSILFGETFLRVSFEYYFKIKWILRTYVFRFSWIYSENKLYLYE